MDPEAGGASEFGRIRTPSGVMDRSFRLEEVADSDGFSLGDASLDIERLTIPKNSRTAIRRRPQESRAMSNKQRWELRRHRWAKKVTFWNSGADSASFGERDVPDIRQYRLQGAPRDKRFRNFLHAFVCGSSSSSGGIGISHNERLAGCLHWMFRVNFLFLFSVMCLAFFGLVLFFSIWIIVAGRFDADCIRVAGESFGTTTSYFADAFALSWTTLSTVGYGSIYPALGHETSDATNCLFITSICSLESFIGVLYSGFCGAILFGKVLRIQSHAQVEFSDPIVIRYGHGVDEAHQEDEDDENADEVLKVPFPVLEFRVVNKLFAEDGGEIMDGTLNVVANVDAKDFADDDPGSTDMSVTDQSVSDSSVFDKLHMGRRDSFDSRGSGKLKKHQSLSFVTKNAAGTFIPAGLKENLSGIGAGVKNVGDGLKENLSGIGAGVKNVGDGIGTGIGHIGKGIGTVGKGIGTVGKGIGKGIGQGIGQVGYGINQIGKISRLSDLVSPKQPTFDEYDSSAKLANKRMFSKMLIETSDHPFFKRVWVGRHILDDTSPIVKAKVKRQIRRNNRCWPDRLNNHQGIRESLQFNQILVSLNGVANVSTSDVYAQKIYDFVDINIGYQFVNIIYKDKDSKLKLDIDLLNDVREQRGGGGEPLLVGAR